MLSILKAGFRQPCSKSFRDRKISKISLLVPRLWIILLVIALPFFTMSFEYFESLERTGPLAAFVADTMFSAMLGGYVILLVILKQGRI
jgi:hypothetical protein